ncbi:MAG: PadR family transcriptional regulator [Candidatus Bathyarchaeia archaeon]
MKPDKEDQTTQNWTKEAQKGYIRLGVLILLNKKPAHGYEIMKEINQRTRGFWRPTAGGVYPILNNLEKSGYIKGHWETLKNRRLKVYTITKSGDIILKRAIVKQSEIFKNLSNLFNEFSRDVLNVEAPNIPMPPSPFTAFLEEKKCDLTLLSLEEKRKQLIECIKEVRKLLNDVNDKINQLKNENQAIT